VASLSRRPEHLSGEKRSRTEEKWLRTEENEDLQKGAHNFKISECVTSMENAPFAIKSALLDQHDDLQPGY